MSELAEQPEADSASHDEWFEDAWRDHAAAVFGYAARRVGRSQAPDIVEDTFMVVWRQRASRPSISLPWLLGIARNLVHEASRQSQRGDRLIEAIVRQPRVETSDQDPAELSARANQAREALLELRESDREALMLCAWEGLATKDAAAALGISHAAFRVRHHRARRRLEALMGAKSVVRRSEEEE
jgi:RNA polymerase sigma-70 factor (ECF subfamily)